VHAARLVDGEYVARSWHSEDFAAEGLESPPPSGTVQQVRVGAGGAAAKAVRVAADTAAAAASAVGALGVSADIQETVRPPLLLQGTGGTSTVFQVRIRTNRWRRPDGYMRDVGWQRICRRTRR
jgi:hypothetical protein